MVAGQVDEQWQHRCVGRTEAVQQKYGRRVGRTRFQVGRPYAVDDPQFRDGMRCRANTDVEGTVHLQREREVAAHDQAVVEECLDAADAAFEHSRECRRIGRDRGIGGGHRTPSQPHPSVVQVHGPGAHRGRGEHDPALDLRKRRADALAHASAEQSIKVGNGG